MSKMLFVNLPVADLAAATRVYEAIGCTQNAAFSDHQASSMVWSDTITFHLLARDYFATFTAKPVADAHAGAQVLLALTQESRAAVDAVVKAAADAGGKADPRPAIDLGWLYNRAFEDADGHTFEAVFADMAAMPAG
ncbi:MULTISPECIES: lactoylglutathione lyase [unclassified Bosea (in: a-proteobacteria)]|uniref:VOC family protein n=1 Tax=unclassified Bosea (in: a-proteobacteria) TaxID=2653178 RepID=UPI000F751109|nr:MULTISPECIES: lactoylglutathione lyase [unclassified Bosea (in: a-proteobacteria)]AZO76281.1 lactoylglutathione lyase [Bosea sp. Tri-49]RXT26209.1 lactoylglutathione lyase [Bosea sp. Tri-39]RXT31451.1 lactoylglutathione lyase [Bosea sp. Tri-54]